MTSSIMSRRLRSVASIRTVVFYVLSTCFVFGGRAVGDDPAKAGGAVAKSVTETGSIIRREAVGKPWQVLAK
ncbi:MAG TPA: hypothetical protein VKE94_11490, partial [Gemmataceae bacterium]|nr:hypothetical protein [Gemmataceae bacterium]